MARRSKYEQLVKPKLDIIEGWARNGLTLEDIAANLGISRQILHKYKTQHEELQEAIDSGREVADIRVENALYRRAVGFYSTEEKIVITDGIADVVTHQVYHKPDVRAQIFWLKNRKPDVWRDKILEKEDVETLTNMLMIAEREPADGKQ